jgi:hypothetical protein
MRDEEFDLTGADRELENRLGRIRPARHAVSRDQVMFEAGRASVRKSLHAWRATSAVLAMGMGLWWTAQASMRPSVPPSSLATQTPAPSPAGLVHGADLDESSYAALRSRVLQEGIEALPAFRSIDPTHAPRDSQQRLSTALQQADS